ncbi:MAG: hypothetical protein NTX50_22615, partial [Candidatus Sumerlaeota bacterium]|nr:hypothetical protein [Candidatus Sumerlaeota bacterium]
PAFPQPASPQPASPQPASPQPVSPQDAELLSLLREGKKIQAIKLYRSQRTDTRLKEAKDYVEALAFRHGLGSAPGASKCFIATAACGDANADEVIVLRRFRDDVLLPRALGRCFVAVYCFLSPPLAALIVRSPKSQCLIRRFFISPVAKWIAMIAGKK